MWTDSVADDGRGQLSPRSRSLPSFTLDQRDQVAGMCQELEIDGGARRFYEKVTSATRCLQSPRERRGSPGRSVIRTLGPGTSSARSPCSLAAGERLPSSRPTPMQLVTVLNRDLWRLEREAPERGRSASGEDRRAPRAGSLDGIVSPRLPQCATAERVVPTAVRPRPRRACPRASVLVRRKWGSAPRRAPRARACASATAFRRSGA